MIKYNVNQDRRGYLNEYRNTISKCKDYVKQNHKPSCEKNFDIVVLAYIVQDIQTGKLEMFRSEGAFGKLQPPHVGEEKTGDADEKLYKGPPYHELASGIRDAVEKDGAKYLIESMRNIMLLKSETFGIHPVLPILAACWFIAEPSRYSQSFVSSLMIMDMLDSFPAGNGYERNNLCLNWKCEDEKNKLTFASKETNLEEMWKKSESGDIIRSTLGMRDIFGEYQFYMMVDGKHPMANKGSASARSSKTLLNHISIQKEGSLLVAWLYEAIKVIKDKDVEKITTEYVNNVTKKHCSLNREETKARVANRGKDCEIRKMMNRLFYGLIRDLLVTRMGSMKKFHVAFENF